MQGKLVLVRMLYERGYSRQDILDTVCEVINHHALLEHEILFFMEASQELYRFLYRMDLSHVNQRVV